MSIAVRPAASGSDVISFSLWGPAPFYSYGAMINLVLAREVYPAWTCRFYVDAAVPPPARFSARPRRRRAPIEDEYPGVGLFQRFLVMNDPTVGRFLVRDCDARLSVAEADWWPMDRQRPPSMWCATMCCTTN